MERLVHDQRKHQCEQECDPGHELRHPTDPPDLAQSLGDGRDARGEGEALGARVVRPADPRDEYQHEDQQDELHQADRVREVVDEDLVQDADARGAHHGARKRPHATDQRPRETEEQCLRPD